MIKVCISVDRKDSRFINLVKESGSILTATDLFIEQYGMTKTEEFSEGPDVGQAVTYDGTTLLIVGIEGDKLKVINPLKGKSYTIPKTTEGLKFDPKIATNLIYDGDTFIITPKRNVISTNKQQILKVEDDLRNKIISQVENSQPGYLNTPTLENTPQNKLQEKTIVEGIQSILTVEELTDYWNNNITTPELSKIYKSLFTKRRQELENTDIEEIFEEDFASYRVVLDRNTKAIKNSWMTVKGGVEQEIDMTPATYKERKAVQEQKEVIIKEKELVEKNRIIANRKATGKTIVVPENADEANNVIFETDTEMFLMTNDQQLARTQIKSFIIDRLQNQAEIVSEDFDNKVLFNKNGQEEFSNIIPAEMFKNMHGLQGFGGTGKTAVIRSIINEILLEVNKKFSNYTVTYLAPTHIASTMLQESLGLNSESLQGVSTIASFLKVREINGELLPISKKQYEDKLLNNKGIGQTDIMILDESSMLSTDQVALLVDRLHSDYTLGKISSFPIMLFLGDYHQLPPIQSEGVGIISSTILRDSKKSSQLTQMMRAKDNTQKELFNLVAGEIDNYLKAKDFGRLYTINYKKILDFFKTSHSNILSIEQNPENVKDVIDLYTDYLVNNDNPDGMFYIHYNKASNSTTLSETRRIRASYLQKLGIPYTDSIVEGEYVVYNGGITINTPSFKVNKDILNPKALNLLTNNQLELFPEENIEIGTGIVKPSLRYKIIQDFTGVEEKIKNVLTPETLNEYPRIKDLFEKNNVTLQGKLFLNRQGKLRGYPAITGLRVVKKVPLKSISNVTYGDTYTITNDLTGLTEVFDVSFDEKKKTLFNDILTKIPNSSLNFDKKFSPSYIGSSHSFQGGSVINLIAGVENVLKYDNTNVDPLDVITSLYSMLTRAKGTITALVPNKVNSIDEFQGHILDPKPLTLQDVGGSYQGLVNFVNDQFTNLMQDEKIIKFNELKSEMEMLPGNEEDFLSAKQCK